MPAVFPSGVLLAVCMLAAFASVFALVLVLTTPYETPGMRLARYVQLVDRRQRLLVQLAGHLARRRRLRGNNKKYLHETMLALQR